MGAPVTWRAFPNGLDPAPLATAKSCGKTLALYARPSGARPHAPQELHIAAIGAEGLGPDGDRGALQRLCQRIAGVRRGRDPRQLCGGLPHLGARRPLRAHQSDEVR